MVFKIHRIVIVLAVIACTQSLGAAPAAPERLLLSSFFGKLAEFCNNSPIHGLMQNIGAQQEGMNSYTWGSMKITYVSCDENGLRFKLRPINW